MSNGRGPSSATNPFLKTRKKLLKAARLFRSASRELRRIRSPSPAATKEEAELATVIDDMIMATAGLLSEIQAPSESPPDSAVSCSVPTKTKDSLAA
jgi:hypothetical protein